MSDHHAHTGCSRPLTSLGAGRGRSQQKRLISILSRHMPHIVLRCLVVFHLKFVSSLDWRRCLSNHELHTYSTARIPPSLSTFLLSLSSLSRPSTFSSFLVWPSIVIFPSFVYVVYQRPVSEGYNPWWSWRKESCLRN